MSEEKTKNWAWGPKHRMFACSVGGVDLFTWVLDLAKPFLKQFDKGLKLADIELTELNEAFALKPGCDPRSRSESRNGQRQRGATARAIPWVVRAKLTIQLLNE